MSESLSQRGAKGIIWSAIERFSTQAVTFIIGVIIARQLSPNDYGLVAMLAVFFSISRAFVNAGFSAALIRKIDRTESDIATVFYFNIVIGFVATTILYFAAPFIAAFYGIELLEQLVKVMSLCVLIGSFGAVQEALLTARIDFKLQAKISLISVILSGSLGVFGAYNGWGVWALAYQMLSLDILRVALLWVFVKWYPRAAFSAQSFNELFGFGSKLLASALLEIIYQNIYTLVIGKFFSATSLGNYSRAHQLAAFPSSNITNIIQRVTYPILSELQNEDERLRHNYRKMLRLSTFLIFPIMMGLSALAHPLILILLTSKWEGCVLLLQIMCFALMWYPIHAINLNLLQVKGRSDLFLRLEVFKKLVGASILCVTIPMGLIAMCYGLIFASLLALVINTHYTGKLINVGYFKQMKDIAPTLLGSSFMGAIVYCCTFIVSQPVLQLTVGTAVGVFIYTTIVLIFKFPEVQYLKPFIKLHKS